MSPVDKIQKNRIQTQRRFFNRLFSFIITYFVASAELGEKPLILRRGTVEGSSNPRWRIEKHKPTAGRMAQPWFCLMEPISLFLEQAFQHLIL